jgi:WhiB family redox-sensing transcriptional regulator
MNRSFDHGAVLGARMGVAEPGWRSRSACRGLPSDMFVSAELMTKDEEATAKAVCASCTVVHDCLSYSIVNAVRFGVWGGLTGDERRPLRQRWLQDRASLAGYSPNRAMSS